jgi:acetyl esterase/lipase
MKSSLFQKSALRLIVCLLTPLFFWCADLQAAEPTHYYTSDEINALPSKPADYRLSYGNDPHQFAELRLPSGRGPYPVAIILHGGCWLSSVATAKNTAALADALRDEGIATWNVEYRAVDDKGGGWPGTFKDAASAADYLKKIASKYSLDLNHVVAIGHSAGGHLALWLAARHKLPSTSILYSKHPLLLSGVITLGGIGDLQAFNAQTMNPCGADTISRLLGNAPELLTQRYQEASPVALLPLGVPQILIYGSDDVIVPASFGQAYAKTAEKSGDTVQLIIVNNAGHHEYVAPNSITWPAVKQSILSLINKSKP